MRRSRPVGLYTQSCLPILFKYQTLSWPSDCRPDAQKGDDLKSVVRFSDLLSKPILKPYAMVNVRRRKAVNYAENIPRDE